VTNNPQTLSLARREQPTAALRTVQRERRFLGGQQHHHAGRTAVPPRHHRQRRSDGHCGGLLALAECCPQSSPDRWWIDSASSGQACLPTLPQARQWQPCRPLYRAGILRFWQLLVLVFPLSSINTLGDSARFALIPALARRAAMAIERANAVDPAIARLAQIVGPLLAGVLITLLVRPTDFFWTL
jgi:hypothetical protein